MVRVRSTIISLLAVLLSGCVVGYHAAAAHGEDDGDGDGDGDVSFFPVIPNPMPAICHGVSQVCAHSLIRLNETRPVLDAWAAFIEANSECARTAVQPCYAGGHIDQGDCDVNCHDGLAAFNITCSAYGGTMHRLYGKVGFDGAMFAVESDVCLPANCSQDIDVLDACMADRICDPISALVPTCELSLDAWEEPWNAMVAFVVLVATTTVVFLVTCIICGQSDRREVEALGVGLAMTPSDEADDAASAAREHHGGSGGGVR